MSATSFQRIRRVNELKKKLEELGIDYGPNDGEKELRELLNSAESEQQNNDYNEEEAIRAHAKELGIKSWHLKSIETLTAEIAEKEGVE